MMTIKKRFIDAINRGELGTPDSFGVLVTQKEFLAYFPDITSQYRTAFLPGATIEKGRTRATCARYLFRIKKGVYRVHNDVLDAKTEQANIGDFYRLLHKVTGKPRLSLSKK